MNPVVLHNEATVMPIMAYLQKVAVATSQMRLELI